MIPSRLRRLGAASALVAATPWSMWGGGITTAKDSELFEPVIFG